MFVCSLYVRMMRMCKSLALEHYTHMTYVCIVTQQNKFIVENFISLLFRFISSSLFFRLCGCWFVCWLIVVCFFFFFFLLLFCSFHRVRSAQFTSIRSICTILSFTSHTREEKKHIVCAVLYSAARSHSNIMVLVVSAPAPFSVI